MRNTDAQIDREAEAYRDMLMRESAAFARAVAERAVLEDITHDMRYEVLEVEANEYAAMGINDDWEF